MWPAAIFVNSVCTIKISQYFKQLLLLLLLLLSSSSLTLSTAIELSLGVSSPYTSTDKTNKNKYTNETTQKYSTNNPKQSKYK